ncbi:hypothetical protein [Micromonospora sp. HUAS LYJ1]|uniref:hypothetical protein n=1 Tax=Micromonospora sp. HUAS LYJ1 TaxID=3061626 RepID=UPI0026722D2E|nr:hypothetical protein [Micromonospora sp. HUAS LYJ1]WKU07283.1 hypothetical protein Q2K16_09655 [Micromonospora sp. HUAS LYJ1]
MGRRGPGAQRRQHQDPKLSRLGHGEQFAYVFDSGDDWAHLARVYVMLTRARTLNEAYVVTDDEPREGTPPAPPTARVAVLADIMRRVLPDRSATETEQQLWADADALHSWTPIYDDLLARAHMPAYLATVRQLHGPALAERLSRDLALPALISKLTTYATAGHEPHELLRRILRVRELDTADDIAAVLCWRLDQLMRHTTADPTIAERADSGVPTPNGFLTVSPVRSVMHYAR